MWPQHIIENGLAIKRNKVLTHTKMWMNLIDIMLSSRYSSRHWGAGSSDNMSLLSWNLHSSEEILPPCMINECTLGLLGSAEGCGEECSEETSVVSLRGYVHRWASD